MESHGGEIEMSASPMHPAFMCNAVESKLAQ